jgi:deoxyhypusine synthase
MDKIMTEIKPISLENVTSYSLKDRVSKVSTESFGDPWSPDGSITRWLESLPEILAGTDLKEIVGRMVQAASSDKTIILAMGAHPIKVGLSPIILDLMERGIISGVAMNGAGIIHDSEVAMAGNTSEDVAAVLGEGKFGMAEETGRLLNAAISDGAKQGMGLGRSIGAMLIREGFPYNRLSLLARAYELNVPVTVHVAIGTDIIHFHPNADGAAIGETSHLDFRIFANLVSTLKKGVLINLGSAVIMPEVFLKALSLVRNLGHDVSNFTTVNMDFIQHYRPLTNVVHRPTLESGRGYSLVGHHEIMFPLLAAAVIEGLEKL